VLPTVAARSSTIASCDAQPSGKRPDGSGVRAGDDQPVHLLRGELGDLERRVPGLLAEGHIFRLAEAFLPLLHGRVARRPPPVDELLGRRRRADQFSDDRRVLVVVVHQHRGGAVAAGRLVGAGRQAAARVRGHDEYGSPAVERGAQ
jgi:hypothetical protein